MTDVREQMSDDGKQTTDNRRQLANFRNSIIHVDYVEII
jgi:hypothetical protein